MRLVMESNSLIFVLQVCLRCQWPTYTHGLYKKMLYLNSQESHNIFSRKNYECADGECANLLFLF